MNKFKKTIVLVTGGFDPLHSGHCAYFNAAKSMGELLVVGLNSDEWLIRKKGAPFLPWIERFMILSNLRAVDNVIAFDDKDNSAIDAIKTAIELYPNDTIVFANGGDRNFGNVPEMKWAAEHAPEVIFEFGVGGEEKTNSSSWILDKWKNVQK